MKKLPCPKCEGTGKVIDQADLGRLFRKRRLRLHLSLRDVATTMEISAPYLSDLERGRRDWNNDLIEKYKLALRRVTTETE